jgi:uncharacterized protein (TIGR02145 family)
MTKLKKSVILLFILFGSSVFEQCTTKSFDYGYGENDAPTVDVGSQHWMVKNLNVDHFANGDPIPQAQTAEEWETASNEKRPAWCYYNSDPSIGSTYGKLYNWYCVNDPRGLAPSGWHVPSDAEWTKLIDYLGGETEAGTKMKSTSQWKDNGNGDNSSRIAGLPGGFRYSDGTFENIGLSGTWWSSSEEASNRTLYFNGTKVVRYTYPKSSGFSVRCIKD